MKLNWTDAGELIDDVQNLRLQAARHQCYQQQPAQEVAVRKKVGEFSYHGFGLPWHQPLQITPHGLQQSALLDNVG